MGCLCKRCAGVVFCGTTSRVHADAVVGHWLAADPAHCVVLRLPLSCSLRTNLCVRFKGSVVACGIIFYTGRKLQVRQPCSSSSTLLSKLPGRWVTGCGRAAACVFSSTSHKSGAGGLIYACNFINTKFDTAVLHGSAQWQGTADQHGTLCDYIALRHCLCCCTRCRCRTTGGSCSP